MIAELRAAPLPPPLSKIAVHLFINFDWGNTTERWELWQSKDAFEKIKDSQNIQKPRNQFEHIYQNLKAPLDGVGGGPSFLIKKFFNEDAETIFRKTKELSQNYPYRSFYRAWPGPNSNTFIATLLQQSGINISLPATAIGKDFNGLKPMFSSQPQHLKMQFLTTGFNYHKKSFLELHCIGLTIGYEKNNKQWKLPFGKGIFPYNNNS